MKSAFFALMSLLLCNLTFAQEPAPDRSSFTQLEEIFLKIHEHFDSGTDKESKTIVGITEEAFNQLDYCMSPKEVTTLEAKLDADQAIRRAKLSRLDEIWNSIEPELMARMRRVAAALEKNKIESKSVQNVLKEASNSTSWDALELFFDRELHTWYVKGERVLSSQINYEVAQYRRIMLHSYDSWATDAEKGPSAQQIMLLGLIDTLPQDIVFEIAGERKKLKTELADWAKYKAEVLGRAQACQLGYAAVLETLSKPESQKNIDILAGTVQDLEAIAKVSDSIRKKATPVPAAK